MKQRQKKDPRKTRNINVKQLQRERNEIHITSVEGSKANKANIEKIPINFNLKERTSKVLLFYSSVKGRSYFSVE